MPNGFPDLVSRSHIVDEQRDSRDAYNWCRDEEAHPAFRLNKNKCHDRESPKCPEAYEASLKQGCKWEYGHECHCEPKPLPTASSLGHPNAKARADDHERTQGG